MARILPVMTDAAEPTPPPATPRVGGWSLARFSPVLVVLLFGAALWILQHALERYRYHDILHALRALPPSRLAAGLLLAALGYLALTGYDQLSLRYLRKRIGFARTTFASFIAYAFSNTLGLPLLTGGSVRLRLYSAWGLTTGEIAQAVAFSAVTFWLGILGVAAVSYLAVPGEVIAAAGLHPVVLKVLSVVSIVLVAAYLAWAVLWKRPLTVRGLALMPPGPALATAQLGVAVVDWLLAAATLYLLLPAESGVSYPVFVGLFLLAQAAGLVSHVPGGLGVFEAVLVMTLGAQVPAAALLASLLVFRVVYYLIPFVVGASLLVAYEVGRRRERLAPAAAALARLGGAAVPRALATVTFVAGAILLASGATPAVGSRLRFLDGVLPLAVIEVSHFIGSLIGLALLLLAMGLRRRLDAAFHLTVLLLVAGVVASLLKGLDYEEAIALALVLALLIPARAHFYRRASLTSERPSPGWIAAVGLALVATVWLGLFAYKHVDYSGEMWWQFALRGDAPRFLRATVGLLVLLGVVAARRLLAPAPPQPALPAAPILDHAAAIVAASPVAAAHLALTGDKSLLFSEDGRGFVMYAVSRRSWVAMGDPVGPDDVREDLAWQFRELVDEHGGVAVFYQVSAGELPLYLDLGLTPLKLGEEAHVPLADFSLDGPERRGLRRSHRQVERAGCSFALVPPGDHADIEAELRRVSDDWLATRNTREKGFSLGRFDPAYLKRLPLGLVRMGGRIVAFATLWPSADRTELSVDLMRYAREAPANVMDYLFAELLQWGRGEGYGRFNLGMAPLSGFESRSLAPLWHRVSGLVYRHGERFYHFQGLRSYKEKFRPVWEPKYLAAPGGLLMVPRVLADVTTLISGGLRGAVAK
jgi:phosphatidylglycerol lysyltransferase